ncbi:hypothetical protein EPUS_01165 [Endocarpon pusillum Z07020]|uniref:NmrA-like domain-containing protein n=1 Tax=Endocarpon pusillum (strain Z07020 / HMAS-L-300199) TaxID=1263415 RepID=U1GB21_ENDPU|nr:uncharacterized protein EPUS_01165 [Endocarpon pusillum Z07020]ERF69208.1 hypothetical protein EPUS_01165 [Endocarpon pusillum Z07020]
MAPSKLFTVFGATGNQGGSVIASVLSNPQLSSEYKLRGITRDPSKPNAKKLSEKGVEMVSADMNDPDALRKAISGSSAVFCVTNYWESMSKETEVKQGKNVADISKEAGVKHLIWSSLPHAIKLTNGELSHIEHFDGKAEVEEYIESIKPGSGMVASYWRPGFFMSNIKGMIQPDQSTGLATWKMPFNAEKTQVGMLAVVEDTGKFVAGLLLADPKSVDGFQVNGVSEWMTPKQIVDTLSETSGTKVEFQEISGDEYESYLPPPIAKELKENMLLVRDYSYFGKGTEKTQAESNKILGDMKLTSWQEFVKHNGPWEWK